MRFLYLLMFSFLFFLFSCNKTNEYDNMLTNLEDRLNQLNDNVISINSNIDEIDEKLIKLNEKINIISKDNALIKQNRNKLDFSKNPTILSDTLISHQPIDFEKLFYDNYSISELRKRTCDLKNIKNNKVIRFEKEQEIRINPSLKNTDVQIYKILEIDKIKRYVKLLNLNYNKEFKLLFETDRQ